MLANRRAGESRRGGNGRDFGKIQKLRSSPAHRLTLAVLLALGLAGTTAWAAPPPPEKFSVGIDSADAYPYYSVENNDAKGFIRDLMDAFAAAIGANVEYRTASPELLINAAADGVLDFVFPDAPDRMLKAKGERLFLYSPPLTEQVIGILVPRRMVGRGPARVRSLATRRGEIPEGWADRLKKGELTLVEDSSLETLIRHALVGRADGVYGDVLVLERIARDVVQQPGELMLDPSLPQRRAPMYLSTVRRADLLRRFDRWLSVNDARMASMRAGRGVAAPHPVEQR